MDKKKEKVVHISRDRRKNNVDETTAAEHLDSQDEKAQDEETQETAQTEHEEAAEQEEQATEKPAKGRRDLSKAAVFISVLTVLLMVVFFYALNRNMAGLSGRVEELATMRGDISRIDGAIGGIQSDVTNINDDIAAMQDKMAILDAVPDITRRTMLRSMLQDLSQRVAFIAKETDTPEQSAKVKAAQELLNQVESDLAAMPTPK